MAMLVNARRISWILMTILFLSFYSNIIYAYNHAYRCNDQNRFRLYSSNSNNKNEIEPGSSSLITLLNLAQEVGASDNIRFRQSSDRLREQFLKSFSAKYNVAKEYFNKASLVLASVDRVDGNLSSDASVLKDIVFKQINGISTKASCVLFYNEPIDHLKALKYPFYFPYDTFPGYQKPETAIDDTSTDGDAAASDGESNGRFGFRKWIKTKLFGSLSSDKDKSRAKKSIVAIATATDNDDTVTEVPYVATKKFLFNEGIDDSTTSEQKYGVRILHRIKSSRDKSGGAADKSMVDLEKVKNGLSIESKKWRNEIVKPSSTDNGTNDATTSNTADSISEDDQIGIRIDGGSPINTNSFDEKRANTKWRNALQVIESAKAITPPEDTPNYALLVHSCIMLSLATYSLKLKNSHPLQDPSVKAVADNFVSPAITMLNEAITNINAETEFNIKSIPSVDEIAAEYELNEGTGSLRAKELVNNALGCLFYSRNNISNATNSSLIQSITSDKACAMYAYDERQKAAFIVFRGTSDPIDVITDITFFSSEFRYRGYVSKGNSIDDEILAKSRQMEVHSGFLASFESILPDLAALIDQLPAGTKLLFTGHSMGGALAQIAAAYFADLHPSLVTLGAPAVGNANFCQFVDDNVHPLGGLRVWNEYDAVPYIALLVGYSQAGIPIKLALSKAAKELFQKESHDSTTATALEAVTPHILYQLGSLVHVFPVMGATAAGKKLVDNFNL